MVKTGSHLKCHKERRYKCIPCDKVFRERRDIARHILYLHQNVVTGLNLDTIIDEVPAPNKGIIIKSADSTRKVKRVQVICQL